MQPFRIQSLYENRAQHTARPQGEAAGAHPTARPRAQRDPVPGEHMLVRLAAVSKAKTSIHAEDVGSAAAGDANVCQSHQ